jgi:integrase/recombinase XerC
MKDKTFYDKANRNPKVSKLVEIFLEYMRVEKNASPHTLSSYQLDLRHWLSFLFENHPGRFGVGHFANLKYLREYLGKAHETYERSTVSRKLSVIKGFLKFLHRESYLEKNIAKLITLPRPHQKIPKILKPEEIVKLIDGIPTTTLRQLRLKAIIELLYSTGIRISELVGLDQEHLDFHYGTARVFGKGSKERMVPMGRHCQKAIHEYIDAMPQVQKHGPKTPLFLNRDGDRVTVRTIQRNLKEFALVVLGASGMEVSPHTLRHSCATHLLAGGAGLREIQELLGHRTLVTTQKYTQVDIARLKASYKKSHPKELKIESDRQEQELSLAEKRPKKDSREKGQEKAKEKEITS